MLASPFVVFFHYHRFPFTTGISGKVLWLSVFFCSTSTLHPSSKTGFGIMVFIEIIDNGRHRTWKSQKLKTSSLSNWQYSVSLHYSSPSNISNSVYFFSYNTYIQHLHWQKNANKIPNKNNCIIRLKYSIMK